MTTAGRKWPSIDLLKLQARGGAEGWNALLTRCLETSDVETVKKTLYGIQAGMADLEKARLADEKVRLLFIRWQKSLENTAKAIFRKKYPNPCDNPLKAKDYLYALEAKRVRDQAFEKFLREASF